MNDSYDVIIVGGGPAGTTLATFVQQAGYRCLILERSTFPRYHIGESLIPQTYGTLDRLGLLPRLKSSTFPVKRSVRFVSPDGKQATPFYFSETIEGDRAQTWQVERSEFDQICLENARKNGVEVRSATSVEKVRFEGEQAVGVRARSSNADSFEIDARVVIDASGHATVIGSQLGLREPVAGLEKGSLWSYYRGCKHPTGPDAGETTIFALQEGGWFWKIPLPNDLFSIGIVDDPRRLFKRDMGHDQAFLQQVEACLPLREQIDTAERVGPVRGSRRLSYLNRQTCGDGWLMLGDARAFLDPIYSSGLYLALASAELAAECVADALASKDCSASRLGRFEPRLMAGVDIIWRLIMAFYDEGFSFGAFLKRFPDQRSALIDCLVGDVVDKDLSGLSDALGQMSPPRPLEGVPRD